MIRYTIQLCEMGKDVCQIQFTFCKIYHAYLIYEKYGISAAVDHGKMIS